MSSSRPIRSACLRWSIRNNQPQQAELARPGSPSDWSTLPPFVEVKGPPTFQLLNKIPTQRHNAPPPVGDNKLPSPAIVWCRDRRSQQHALRVATHAP